MSIWKRQIGIVGGLGPFAHIEFERRLLAAAAEKLGHDPSDQELPPWVLVSLPHTPDRTSALLSNSDSPVPCMLRSLQLLQGCDFAVITCNTAHAFLPQIQKASTLPILNIIEETIREAVRRFGPDAKLALLAATGTLKSKVYVETARRVAPSVQFVTPYDLPDGEALQNAIMGPIFNKPAGIKCGGMEHPETRKQIESELFSAVDRFSGSNVSGIIAGCTELSLVLKGSASNGVPFLDPLAISARAALDIAAGDRPLPR